MVELPNRWVQHDSTEGHINQKTVQNAFHKIKVCIYSYSKASQKLSNYGALNDNHWHEMPISAYEERQF